ncbi:hypothetical protein [Angustibacter aerolatus]
MPKICATCPSCGSVDLTADEVLLCQCSVADWSFYRFTCPGCGESIRKDAPARARRLLMLAGVEPVSWQVPLEALEPHAGEPITFDEVLEFALRLEQVGDPLTELAAPRTSGG